MSERTVSRMVDPRFVSWNPIGVWLKRMDEFAKRARILRRGASCSA